MKSPQGGFCLWLDNPTVNRLDAFKAPRETYSKAILHFAEGGAEKGPREEAVGLP